MGSQTLCRNAVNCNINYDIDVPGQQQLMYHFAWGDEITYVRNYVVAITTYVFELQCM